MLFMAITMPPRKFWPDLLFPSSEKKMSDPRMDEFLKRAGIRLITEETLLIDDSFLSGRPGR